MGCTVKETVEQMENKITVKSILIEWLKANGFDGLAGDDCGCGLDDLMCCDYCCDTYNNCQPAYRVECTKEYCENKCELGSFSVCDGDWEDTKEHFTTKNRGKCT